jgi:hypothetical protein
MYNSTLQERKGLLLTWIEDAEKRIKEHETELKVLENLKEGTHAEIMVKLFSQQEGFKIDKKHGKYQHILGGDGRSQPWDETREGIICTITSSEYYLTSDQISEVKKIMLKEPDVDHVEFKYVDHE